MRSSLGVRKALERDSLRLYGITGVCGIGKLPIVRPTLAFRWRRSLDPKFPCDRNLA